MANQGHISNLNGRKDHNYGYEHGHSYKNEVRKESWIKKRYRAPKGYAWRKEHGYESNPMVGVFRDMSDWSDVDSGHPGAPSKYQVHRRLIMIQLCQDVFDAAMLVERAKNMGPAKQA